MNGTTLRRTRETKLTCAMCPAYRFNFCDVGVSLKCGSSASKSVPIYQTVRVSRPRSFILRDVDLNDAFPIICLGWAAAFRMLHDGQRQILSFLLPGDVMSATLLFEPKLTFSVEAITQVSYRILKRSDVRRVLRKSPDLYDKLSSIWIDEKIRAEELIVDLGRRTADERIARLILELAERLASRNMTSEEGGLGHAAVEMDFPLRQYQIANATGLTPAHVGKVLRTFHRQNLIRISSRSLSILDSVAFRRLAYRR